MPNNHDTLKEFQVGESTVRGLGSFHKTLPHNEFGEVITKAFVKLVDACAGVIAFADVPKGDEAAAQLVNPQAGLAADQLTLHPASYSMGPAPTVLSTTTAAEMTELYWMALLRDLPFDQFENDLRIQKAAAELDEKFKLAVADSSDPGHLIPGVDAPGTNVKLASITKHNVFRLGLPGEEIGPLLSQFFVRPIPFGTQTIDTKQRPYKSSKDYLTEFSSWLYAQNTGLHRLGGQPYPKANEESASNFEEEPRYVSTMRDLARFVNKDALHQAYFNAALVLLSGGAKWTPGNPYSDTGALSVREAGFGVLGGPHILALVSEVATRALKVVWNQKWQVNLRLRPEAYGGLVHVQNVGVEGAQRPYGIPDWVNKSEAAKEIFAQHKSYLLPMAFTPGGPIHPAYGAGHACVAGACVTVLKAYFKTFETIDGVDQPLHFDTLVERDNGQGQIDPFGDGKKIKSYFTGFIQDQWGRFELPRSVAKQLTIEGELNKLAQNVAMGRSMGGVHWRTDNSRSLLLGEALAAGILAEITTDINEDAVFEFRTFARRADGQPKKVRIQQGRIYVDGSLVDSHASAL